MGVSENVVKDGGLETRVKDGGWGDWGKGRGPGVKDGGRGDWDKGWGPGRQNYSYVLNYHAITSDLEPGGWVLPHTPKLQHYI